MYKIWNFNFVETAYDNFLVSCSLIFIVLFFGAYVIWKLLHLSLWFGS